MGRSDKPAIAYRVEDQARYLEAFIAALGLESFVLVLHDWGSALGLDWARRHADRVRGLALMEFITPVPTWLDMSERGAAFFRAYRDPAQGRRLLVDQNAFIEQLLPASILRTLSPVEMDAYRRPFLDPADREPVYRFPNELPIAGAPADIWAKRAGVRRLVARDRDAQAAVLGRPGSAGLSHEGSLVHRAPQGLSQRAARPRGSLRPGRPPGRDRARDRRVAVDPATEPDD